MKLLKTALVVLSLVGMTLSAGSMLAFEEENQDPPGDPGGGGVAYHVTCHYNEYEHLVSKTCTAGGSYSCNCP